MARSGSFSSSSSLLALAALAMPAPLAGQSSHLSVLERTAPAIATEPVSATAAGGWASAWLAPAAGGTATGVLVGVEHRGFAALTTVLAAARVRAGPLWQVGFAQTSLGDLFDDELLATYPGLAALGASATQLTADAVLGGDGLRFSVGWRYERDELLGDATSLWLGRGSAAVRLPLGFRGAGSVERAFVARRVDGGVGRLTVGIARPFHAHRLDATWGAGAMIDDTWAIGRARQLASTTLRVTLADLLSFAVAAGAERDPFASDGWLGFVAFGLGLDVGAWSADFRRGGAADGQATPTALSVLWAPER